MILFLRSTRLNICELLAIERSPIDMQVADPPPPYSQHSMDAVANTEERNATSENIDVHEPLVIRLIRTTNLESR